MHDPTAEPGSWLGMHIFYGANPRPMLLDCVRPLVDELTTLGLLDSYFFMNYWQEGPHVRLRLKPAHRRRRARGAGGGRGRGPAASWPTARRSTR